MKYRAFLVFAAGDSAFGDQLHKALEAAHVPPDLVGRDTSAGPVPRNLRPIFCFGGDLPRGNAPLELQNGQALSGASHGGDASPGAGAPTPPAGGEGCSDRPSEPVSDRSSEPANVAEIRPETPVLPEQPSEAPPPVDPPADPPSAKSPPTQHAVSDEAAEALSQSLFLVVVCSPDAAKAEHVNEAVRRFKAMGKRDRIIAVIAAGEPKHAENECFPPALRFKLAADGSASSEAEEPAAGLVIDARAQGDDKETAIVRLTAALLGLSFETVLMAGSRARARRARMRTSLAAALAVMAVLAGAVAWIRYDLAGDEKLLDDRLAFGTGLALGAVELASKLGLPDAAARGVAAASETGLGKLAEFGSDTPLLRYRRAAMLLAFARQDEALGHAEAGRMRMPEAATLLAAINPDQLDMRHERDLALAQLVVGNALLARGAPDEALKVLRPSLATMERREVANSDNVERQRDLSLVANAVGDALFAKGLIEDALRRYRQSLALRERLLVIEPKNDQWRRDFSVSHERLGDVLFARAELAEALKAYRTSLMLRLGAVDAEATGGWQRQLSVSYNKIGDVLVARGALEDALNSYRTGLALQLAAVARDDIARRDLSVSYERIGDVLKTQRAWDDALAAYHSSLALRERLAAADPGNPRWRRDLPTSHERIGDVLMGRGAFDEAAAAYRTSLKLRQQIAQSDADSIAAQADIAVSYNKLGDALAAKGAMTEALESFRDGLQIRERLAALDPANAQSQWDLLVLQWRLASSGDDPAKRFGVIVAMLRDLAAKQKLTVDQARWLPAAEQELARLNSQ